MLYDVSGTNIHGKNTTRAITRTTAPIDSSGSASKPEFKNFLNYSVRSTFETISGLFVAKKRKYITEERFQELYKDGELLARKIQAFRSTL